MTLLELPQRTSTAILYGDFDWIFGIHAQLFEMPEIGEFF
jgi:hypothetical protein